MYRVVKRDGRIVPFDREKIEQAIEKSFMASGTRKTQETARELTNLVMNELERDENLPDVPSVEQIQDTVERILIEKGFVRSAKSYILYRAERSRVREMNTRLMKTFEDIAYKDAIDSDIKRENANINGDTAMGSMLKFGSEGSKQFYEMYVLDPRFAKAHREGDIHIHDLDFYTLTTTCCQIDLLDLFHNGFSTGHGVLREPNDIYSYSALACIAIQANQNDQHGGQSVVNFDYGMAPGVKKTYYKRFRDNLSRALELLGGVENAADEAVRILDAVEAAAGCKPELAVNEAYDNALKAELASAVPSADADRIVVHHQVRSEDAALCMGRLDRDVPRELRRAARPVQARVNPAVVHLRPGREPRGRLHDGRGGLRHAHDMRLAHRHRARVPGGLHLPSHRP